MTEAEQQPGTIGSDDESGGDHDRDDRTFLIFIDKREFRVEGPTITGTQLRALPEPPIGPEFDLYEEAASGDDPLISNETVVHLRQRMHFFTAPSNINPG